MNTNDLFKAVMQLDLEPIKMKLMHVASGEGWSLEKANAVEKEYRRFLCLMKMYPDEDTAPLVDVDTFWHYHILDTMKYAADCEQAFGYFLHHYPYVGMGGEDDEQFRLDSGDRMRELYEATFGETYPGAIAQAADGASAYCASPRIEAAYCASPRVEDTAYCASPRVQATAYCASPRIRASEGALAATAYCASPRVGTAYCASPRIREGEGAVAATAYCASPRVQTTAYCASPRIKAGEGAVAATAYCASPRVQATAYCASPRVGTAYCASPRIEAQPCHEEAAAA
ncbi:hypothetical protein SAMN05428966_102282 [Massilia sp. PDC64]|nr:hypothetical protein [Massilia sp. PDC64]SDC76271.1 hypothetical protein SAMN05428966_102282 [Massilia sp. PDC64]